MVTSKTGTVQKFPKPRGRAPKNASGQPATWDPDRGEWTGVVKKTKPDGVPKPRGRAPLGATWDYDKGEWVGGTKPSKPKPKTPKSPKPAGAKKPAAKPAKNANDKFPKPRARRALFDVVAATSDGITRRRGRAPLDSTGAPAAWDSETGVWVGVAKKTKPDGVPKPRGRAPLGAEWNYETGEWEGGAKTSAKKKK